MSQSMAKQFVPARLADFAKWGGSFVLLLSVKPAEAR